MLFSFLPLESLYDHPSKEMQPVKIPCMATRILDRQLTISILFTKCMIVGSHGDDRTHKSVCLQADQYID